ncbi:MAG: ABC transporter permease [Anaerolineae bacterium]|nr:ABC transporter permease [Anaerolineae bacterium]
MIAALKSLWRRREHARVVFLGLLVVGAGLALFISASQTSSWLTAGELQVYWRTSYDLLVRPPGASTETEREHGLVRANYLSGLYGGISIDQYQVIRDLPEVEVAAPIAMVGFLTSNPTFIAGLPEPGHLYRFTRTIATTDNVCQYVHQSADHFWMDPLSVHRVGNSIYIGSAPADEDPQVREQRTRLALAGLYIDAGGQVHYEWGRHSLFLLAGIDPEQEARLIGFDQALLKGRYFAPDDQAHPETLPAQVEIRSPSGEVMEAYSERHVVPLFINSHVYAQATAHFTISRLSAPDKETLITQTLQSGRPYLEALPVERQLASREMGLEEAYEWVFEKLATPQKIEPAPVLGDWTPPEEVTRLLYVVPWDPFSAPDFQRPGEVSYRALPSPFAASATVLEALRTGVAPDGQALFRTSEVWPFHQPHMYKVLGAFDLAGLRDPYAKDLNAVPMETYRPPVVTLRYDEDGHPVSPVQMIPTLNAEGYIQVPPYALTTIEGARVFAGDQCISAIRVRVRGVETLNEESWQRIQAVAQAIRDRTGLQVDTTLGSSPTPLLVHLPGVGYVEEPWVKTGVSITVHRGFDRADLVLFGAMLAVLGLYVFSLSSISILSRRREVGLLAALGWRQGTLFRSLLAESFWLALAAGLLGMLLSAGAIALLHLCMPAAQTAMAIPLGLALYLLGAFYPAWRAARQAPALAIQTGELRPRAPRAAQLGRLTPLSYGLRGALQRLSRTTLSVVGMAVSTGLVVLFLLVNLELRGTLEGTLLGTHIALQVRPYHYAMAGVCFAVSALALTDVMLLNVLERRREIGTLKAVGWRTDAVAGLFVREGALLGLLGGLLGDGLSLAAFALFYRAFSAAMAWAAALGLALPVAAGALAALYPARLATTVPPAQAVRYE